jgi:hypothetical protein
MLGSVPLASTVLGALGTVGVPYGLAWKLGSILLSTALDIGLFLVSFRILTARGVGTRSRARSGAPVLVLIGEFDRLPMRAYLERGLVR